MEEALPEACPPLKARKGKATESGEIRCKEKDTGLGKNPGAAQCGLVTCKDCG